MKRFPLVVAVIVLVIAVIALLAIVDSDSDVPTDYGGTETPVLGQVEPPAPVVVDTDVPDEPYGQQNPDTADQAESLQELAPPNPDLGAQ